METREKILRYMRKCFSFLGIDEMTQRRACAVVNKAVESEVVQKKTGEILRYDQYTFHHSIETAYLSVIIGIKMGYGGKELMELAVSGLLHDLGKTTIALDIINKPARLTKAEYQIVKVHPVLSYYYLKDSGLNSHILKAVYQHHESITGSGYPSSAGADEISIPARIVAVADKTDAICNKRVYHEERSYSETKEIMFSNREVDQRMVKCLFA